MVGRIAATAALAAVAGAGFAADKPAGRAAPFKRLVDCRGTADRDARLACYDREVAALDAAEAKSDVVIVDREQVRSARRSLFGLRLPRIELFGPSKEPEKEEVKRVDTTIAAIARTADGHVTFTTAEGAVWRQIDDFVVAGRLQPGGGVRIVRNRIGSFFATLEGRPGFKVERLNR